MIEGSAGQESEQELESGSAPRPRRSRRRRIVRWSALGVAVLLAPLAWSYVAALRAPGTDSWSIRSVEWMRAHGGSRIVAATERWWYSRHQPRRGGPPAAGLLQAPGATPPPASSQASSEAAGGGSAQAAPSGSHLRVPDRLRSLAGPELAGEGVWRPAGRLVSGLPAVYTTEIRPDPVHTSLATGVAWIDPTLTRAVMFAGVQVPGGAWPDEAPVPAGERSGLVAAFNSGFRLGESRGGYFADGRTARPLVAGAASLVIDRSGRVTVGEWGRDVQMAPSVVAVRQNLSLIVDNGAPVAGLDENIRGLWGATLGNRLLVWRSGVGVRADGSVVYAAGNGLSVSSLAAVLADAGAVRAMELDINSEWTRFFTYDSGPGPAAGVLGTKLVPDMRSSPSIYLEAETRDFIALLAR